jgi:hypothetical protein
MVLHGPLADAEVGGDVLAGLPREHQIQDLALARGETCPYRKLRPTILVVQATEDGH